MSSQAVPAATASNRYLRPLILGLGGMLLFYTFWFTSRYPSLFSKADHLSKGDDVASMAWGSAKFALEAGAPVWQQILYGAFNWLDGMKVGMTFGVLFGALLHTILYYYPLRLGKNRYLNTIIGAIIGAPMGVCANCSVPAACGLTRGKGRAETALGFLFSSPNFNPVVLTMTFAALPLAVSLSKVAMLLLLILFVVPFTIQAIERREGLIPAPEPVALDLPAGPAGADQPTGVMLQDLFKRYFSAAWALARSTIFLMILASLVASALLTLLPWNEILATATPLKLAFVALISTFMPVPIALDIMFAAQLGRQGISTSYVMLFALTLGTFSIVPVTWLWREVSPRLATVLFGFILGFGWLAALLVG